MTLYVQHGPHLSALADSLAEYLGDAPADPFEPIVVAVPTAGVRDWLTRRLAERLGVTANIAMPFPGRFLAAALGTPLAADDPWQVDRLTWAVLAVLDSGTVDVPGWTNPDHDARSHRFVTARRIADLLDRYAANRPQVLQQWQRGAIGDGTLAPAPLGSAGADEHDDRQLVRNLDPAMHWQYHVWRAVRERIGVASPAELLPELVDNLRAGLIEPALPSVVAVFGAGALAPAQLDIVIALATVRNVRLSVISPSAVRWHRTVPLSPGRLVSRRRFDETRADVRDGHPLVQSWGRLSIETAALLRGLEPAAVVAGRDDRPDREPVPTTLLEHVQRDIRLDRPPTVYPGPAEPVDGTASVQVHACHGVTRQLEVLRDVLGHLFTADSSLQPRDVLVLCPDVRRFEPFASAVFARGSLPVPLKVSDLSLGSENPVASALASIVAAVADRCTTVEVLAVAALEPVRRRLGITVDDLARFGTWTEALGTNWGLDTNHRSRWLDVAVDAGTWESALESLLLGAATPAPSARVAFAGIVPHDDIGTDDVASAGRLAELVARLRRVRDLAAGTGSVEHWSTVLVETLGLLCSTAPADAWQMADVLRAIDEMRGRAVVAGTSVDAMLDWSDVRSFVEGLVAGDPGRLSLRSGRVTMTGMVPVRNVPAKVVCLLGFDEVSLRPPATDGDDLLAVRPCVGERDRRREQRHLVLDALMATERHFVVVCDGRDVTTNRRMRFAVQLTELLDVIDASLQGGLHQAGQDSPVVVHHPRRAYDERLFTPPATAFSYDDTMLRAALARRAAREGASTPVRWSTDAPVPLTVDLAQLTEACTRPARTLLRDGLDVRLPRDVEPQDDNIPLSVSPLAAASIGERLLDRYRRIDRGRAVDWDGAVRQVVREWADAEALAAGTPPGRLIEQSLDTIEREVAEMLDAIEACGIGIGAVDALGARDHVDVDVTLRQRGLAVPPHNDGVTPLGGLRLVDAVSAVTGTTICRLQYRRPKKRVTIGAALDVAAAVATTGSTDWCALAVTRGPSSKSPKPECHVLRPVGDVAAAMALLEVAGELRVAALRGAVPIFESTSEQLYRTGVLDEDELFGNDHTSGDMVDAETRFVWGTVTLAEILELRPSPADLAALLWGAIDAFISIEKLGAVGTADRTGRR